MKYLTEYLKHLEVNIAQEYNPEVLSVADDSRLVGPGTIFCAIKGENIDGHKFIPQAVKAGAVAIVCSDSDCYVPNGVVKVVVQDAYAANALLWECYYDYPGRELGIIAITGTNGKTTTAFMLKQLMQTAGLRCGLITTVKYDLGQGEMDAERTTPMPGDLHRMFRDAVDAGCTHLVMEASSHGLAQRRLGRTPVKTAVFTNLSGDHLDYHRTMEEYFQAKKVLFSEYLAGEAVINADDEAGQRLLLEYPSSKSFGRNGKDCRIIDVRTERDNTYWALDLGGRKLSGTLPLIGEHNVENFAAAATAAWSIGVSPDIITEGLDDTFRVPGRLEKFNLPNGAVAFVDYAHTDDALRNVLKVLRELCHGRLFCVFGCGGDRDRTKRPRMAQAAAEFSDVVIVTSDNPRGEEPENIIADIIAGIPGDCECVTEIDRKKAIDYAVSLAGTKDVVLVAGKGHEAYQEIKGRKYHFDDREIIAAAINK